MLTVFKTTAFRILVLAFLAVVAQAQVRVWQGTLTLPTYEEGLPDPNPPFDQFTTNRFNYPYTLRTNLTGKRADHAWRAVYLENEYLKCSVLPDIGGHLYTCIDKISGKSMFYANPSIKKAAIAYRGAWAAFGVEFNFPVSHNWVSMSPVNFAFANHEDGSASVTVGNVDRVYGMEWAVELVLRPKSTLLEEKVTLSNRSDVRHRFYWWNNAGVPAWDDTRIVYPMRFAATHGFTEVHPWPVDTDGVDYSLLKNHTKGPVSMFVHGSREPFMGVWDPQTNAGIVHFAEYEKLPSKKIWSWGVDADGLDWRKALSDDNSAYLEVQGGLFRNQETYAFLEPRQVIKFSEYWMPVREIGGISRANLYGVASLVRKSDSLIVGFNANRAIPHASVAIINGKQGMFQENVDLAPERAWIHEIPNADSKAKYTIEIRDAKGVILLRQTEGVYDWVPESEVHVGAQPSYHIPDPDKRTTDDWLQLGDDDELNGRSLDAFDTYKEALAKFPGSFALGKAAGRLAASLERYEEAKQFLEPLHLRNTSDTELSYYLGIAYEGLGETQHARVAYEQAERLPVVYAAAALRLGELLAREGDLGGAENHLAGAVKAAPEDIRAYEELVAIKTASGKGDESHELAKEGLTKFPLSAFLREEGGTPDPSHLAQDANRVLGLAAQYMRLGLYAKALGVLSKKYPAAPFDQTEPGWPAVQDHPLVAYFRGYCREKLGQSGANDYAAAAKLSTAYVFPNTAEELSVLRAVVGSNPSDATAHYLLGTFYFAHGETDGALAEWSQAHKYGPNLPVLSASTGLALLHIKNDSEHALEAFQDGLRSDPQNVAVYVGMDQAQSLLHRPASERVKALQKYPNLDAAPPSLMFELILNLAEAGDFDRAIALFYNHFFAREEGGTNVRQVWVEVQLQRILALKKANRCEDALSAAQRIGSPVPDLDFTRDGLEPILKSSRGNYLLGSVYSSCGKSDEAKTRFEAAVAAGASPDQTHWAWLAAKQLPQFDQALWVNRIEVALDQATSRTETSGYPSWWFCTEGTLERDLGKEQEAEASFHKALLLPDRMLSYHFTRLAKSQATP